MESKEVVLRQEYEDLQFKLRDPAIFTSKDYPKLAKRASELEAILDVFDKLSEVSKNQSKTAELAHDKDPEIAAMAEDELAGFTVQRAKLEAELTSLLSPKDPSDEREAILEIRAAAGGDEASLFAADLMRLYTRYAERQGWRTELIAESPSEAGGYKEVILGLRAPGAYGRLKFEAGVHRVQRVPVTESSGRIHTSTVTVAVLPEAEESDITIKPEDIRVDVFRSSGHGGQSVNTTDSAVRITHLPTGLVVSCQDEKSQLKNKAKALGVLRSRLLSRQMAEEQQQLGEARRKLIGSGERSEKVRTYNFPQDRITDHRINYSRSNLPAALDGDIDDLIAKLRGREQELLTQDLK